MLGALVKIQNHIYQAINASACPKTNTKFIPVVHYIFVLLQIYSFLLQKPHVFFAQFYPGGFEVFFKML